MSEFSQEQYIYELEQALEKILSYFEPSDNGYVILEYGLDEAGEDMLVSTELSAALDFAERTLYGYQDID